MATKKTEDLQVDQQQLMEEAMQRPGVADAIAAYGRIQQYVAPLQATVATGSYATGGNGPF